MEQIVEHIGKLETQLKEYKQYGDKSRNLNTANEIISGVSVISGVTSIVSAVTVIGIPAALATGVVSLSTGIVSVVLSKLAKSAQNRHKAYTDKIQLCSETIKN